MKIKHLLKIIEGVHKAMHPTFNPKANSTREKVAQLVVQTSKNFFFHQIGAFENAIVENNQLKLLALVEEHKRTWTPEHELHEAILGTSVGLPLTDSVMMLTFKLFF